MRIHSAGRALLDAYIFVSFPVVYKFNSTSPREHSMAQLQKVQFDQLRAGAAVYVLRETVPLFHAVDVAKIVSGTDQNQAAEKIRKIPSGLFDPKRFQVRMIKLPSGTKKTKFVTYEDVFKLVMAIGGKTANSFKAQFIEILTRVFAGDPLMMDVIATNAASNAPIHALARESETMGGGHALNDGDMGIEDAGTGSELDDEEDVEGETLKVTKAVWDNVSRQKAEMKEMKTLAEYISYKQKEGAAAQIKAEEAKQATFVQENAALTVRYAIELGHVDTLGKRRAAEFEEEDRRRAKELDFIKNKRLALEGPLVADTPPVAAVPAPDPRSVMEIVEEEDYWKDLTRPQRKELVCTVGGRLPKVGVYAAPGKVSKVDPYGKEWDTNVYDRQDHSAIRGISHIVLKEMAKKLPKGRVTRPRDSDSRQRGLDEFTGFNIHTVVTRI